MNAKNAWPRDEAGKAINEALRHAVTEHDFRDRCLQSSYSARQAVQEVTAKAMPDGVEIRFTTLQDLARLFVLELPQFQVGGLSAVPSDMRRNMICTLGMDTQPPVWARAVAEPALNEALRHVAVDRSLRDRCLVSPASAKEVVEAIAATRVPAEAEIWFKTIEELHRIFIIQMPDFVVGSASSVKTDFDPLIRCCWPVYGPHPFANG